MSDKFDLIEIDAEGENQTEIMNEKLKIISGKCIGTHTKFIDATEIECAKIEFRCGREVRYYRLRSLEDAKEILTFDFYKYSFIEGYQAIVDYSSNEIICGVHSASHMSLQRIVRLMQGTDNVTRTEDPKILVSRDESDLSPKIYFEQSPPALQVLGEVVNFTTPRNCIRLINFPFSDQKSAISIMKRYAEALLFQIDLEFGITPYLARERKDVNRVTLMPKIDPSLEFPKFEYDEQPISLYTYAVNARQMPLLQFLAFYQVIEFYYPFHVQGEAKRTIRNTLRRADFRVDRDSDISQLINKLRPLIGDRFSKESEQLKYTLKECVDQDEVRRFISSTPAMEEHFSKEKTIKAHKISLNSPDILSDISNRIYQIRCRIVHTKADDISATDPILPYSKEEQYMEFEINLIRYLARMTINANGVSINSAQ